ncbi:FAD-dependent oxidoreductase [Brachybacterium saurashtrense]|uniref:Sarcosine oxidase subunit alpha n=1 Tax=Brachybacterium saurashtrense TaxID=556288 RepID=A0A345YR35_9MICO|nr:FAD-dependent oxidoreductase [Brachybacterium saurashtrense]AXK46387.1 FAD-dependent oxidoreductase [Brachybacterium saurashtrense]RRR24128.1 FAD-dependent oxidoreductase [Brachybacterium saurashtrense]
MPETQTPRRGPAHGIDPARPLTMTVDGETLPAVAGDTVASALLAAGRLVVAPSIYLRRPRGLAAAGLEEPNALLTVHDRREHGTDESMLPATAVEAVDGLEASLLSGLGTLDPREDRACYDHMHVHTDVLVVGAGPAGLAAAREAARSGARVMLLDEQPLAGGSLLSSRGLSIDGQDAMDWADGTVAGLRRTEDVAVLERTTVVGSYDANYLVGLQKRTDHLGHEERPGVSRQRVWHLRAAQVVLAPGAMDRPVVFAHNDRPGVMLAAAVQTYLNRYGVAAGEDVAVLTTNDSAWELVADLHDAGVRLPVVLDSRPEPSARAAAVREATGVDARFGWAVVDTEGEGERGRLSAVHIAPLDADGEIAGEVETVPADLLAVSGGLSPLVHLHSQRQGRIQYDEALTSFVAVPSVEDQHLAGAVRGTADLAAALAEGAQAGAAAATAAGHPVTARIPHADPSAPAAPARPLWLVPSPDSGPVGRASEDPERWTEHIVDLQRDQSVRDVLRALGAGMRAVEHVKRYTSISTGADQGKTSGVAAIGVMSVLLGEEDLGGIGTTTYRAPYAPVSFAALAGRRRGQLFDPARITSVHQWHLENGAVWEDVGQWKRPRYFPRDGEDMDAAVLRECAAVRGSVGMMDGTTLGKIEIRGADAAQFLNRIYTNGFLKVPVGKGRYGVMCGPDGMIMDDGVTLRLAEDHFFMTTTSSGAAAVLDHLEEWHQTEWPELDVFMTSVTEQWTTITVAGPRSRDVIAKVAPHLDVSQEAFGFMEVRDTVLASGIPARIPRISFSGELAFEINVEAFYGRAAWEAVHAAGAEFGITVYGTETMHVLRAEKGLIIVGQDTDGTITPHDANMSWVVGAKKKDFVGKRSLDRPDTRREDRRQLVGLLSVDGRTRLEEGAQIVEATTPITPEEGPVPMIGWVSSSYLSAELDQPFALALIDGGLGRLGETVRSPQGDRIIDLTITSPVLVDPEGARRDG